MQGFEIMSYSKGILCALTNVGSHLGHYTLRHEHAARVVCATCRWQLSRTGAAGEVSGSVRATIK